MSISEAPHGACRFPDTIVASVQMESRVGHKADNVARSIRKIEEAAANGASLVVLPELTNSGYVFTSREEAFGVAESLPGGTSAAAWSEAASG